MATVLPDINPNAFSDVVGVAQDGVRIGVIGSNPADNAFGFLGGRDLTFHQHAGVYGQSDQQGVIGRGTTDAATGIFGSSAGTGFGVRGESLDGVAIQGQSFSRGTGLAGRFIGNVHVQGNPGSSSGDLRVEGTTSLGGFTTFDTGVKINGNAEITGNLSMSSPTSDIVLGDIAEGFGTHDGANIEPGTVVVLNGDGLVRPGDQAYDKKVAGVVSGAGVYRPAVVLDRPDPEASRMPVALMGKVCCKVDARYSPIEIGDLLTTSATVGHAMKAVDPLKSFGAVIGKALRPLNAGCSVIPILIALQ